MTTEQRLRRVFTESLELPQDIDIDSVRYRDTAKWDSLEHMALVVAIEDEFDVELGSQQIIDINSFAAALEALREVGVAD